MSATAAPPATRRFVLWREVLLAYLSPAATAGAGALITGQRDLLIAAVTSIAGTSALAAALIGGWLQRRGIRRPWTVTAPRPVLLVWFVVLTAGTAGLLAWLALDPLGLYGLALPGRLQFDLPVSGAIAAVVIPLRWRAVNRARS